MDVDSDVKPGDQRPEPVAPDRGAGEAVPACNHAIAGPVRVEFTDKPEFGLKSEPLQPDVPEPVRVAGEQGHTPGPGDANSFPDKVPLVDMECRDAVLDADDPVEELVGKPELNRIHFQELTVGKLPEHLPAKIQAGPRSINTDDLPGFSGQGTENPAVAAAEFKDSVLGSNESKDMVQFGLKILLRAWWRDVIAAFQPLGRKSLTVVVTHTQILGSQRP